MVKLKIRKATNSDKIAVLKFCQNTFSWGDYVKHVWDFWLSEGHLFLAQMPNPVGICHAFYSGNQVWVEGIRIKPDFRHQGIASELVRHAELASRGKNISFSYMLIDIENSASISMAKSLNYEIFQTWNYYSVEPKNNKNYDVTFKRSGNLQSCTHYVKSWRWIPIDDETLESLYAQNRIVNSSINKDSIAIMTESEHFDRTLMVTLFPGSDESAHHLLSFLQNFGSEKDYKQIQILTREKLPEFDTLESKISFYLMKKSLS